LTSGVAGERSTSARHSARRAQITARAALILQRHGYAGASMQQIADAVGLSKASLYYYVGSKDDLLFAVLEEVNVAGEAIVADVTRMPVSPLERLAAYLRAWVHFNVEHLAIVTVYTRDLDQLDRRRRLSLEAERDRRFDFVTDLVRAAQADGDVGPEIDPDSVGHVTLGMVGYMHTWYRPRHGAGAAELGDLMASMVMGGLSRRDR
jgi:AcrR family transcriptional regulator